MIRLCCTENHLSLITPHVIWQESAAVQVTFYGDHYLLNLNTNKLEFVRKIYVDIFTAKGRTIHRQELYLF